MTNERPIIGILCIDVATKLYELYGPTVKSYIAASYVKFLECSGARVVPIWIGKDEQYYRDIMKNINGILLPGGAVYFEKLENQKPEQTNECVRSSEFIYRIAVEINNDGVYFPLWGICLGYELLLYHSSERKLNRQNCTKMNKSMVLELEKDFLNSKLFQSLPREMESILRTETFAFHFHQFCITKNDLCEFEINDQWKVTSVNRDENGLEFISTIEHVKYPFYGVQFHPEKVIFEWSLSDSINHTENSVKCAQYLSNFFVSECRKNLNSFSNKQEEDRHLIYKFPVEFTGIKNSKWMQCYLFSDKSNYDCI
ncbi:gamma-glutamyl hydrolase [Episyrphus balteatus]|uniref:gamma-glutamyl hydrolase n=1 Tax=Episyrphus balteatus TaxID=286459 RepID=UPI002485D24F|nr:gamma-glutamyl hydrolase [Episyrphus balteatus]